VREGEVAEVRLRLYASDADGLIDRVHHVATSNLVGTGPLKNVFSDKTAFDSKLNAAMSGVAEGDLVIGHGTGRASPGADDLRVLSAVDVAAAPECDPDARAAASDVTASLRCAWSIAREPVEVRVETDDAGRVRWYERVDDGDRRCRMEDTAEWRFLAGTGCVYTLRFEQQLPASGESFGRIHGMGRIDTGGGRGTKASLGGKAKATGTARTSVGAGSVAGFCREADVQRVVNARRSGISYCYEKELARDPGLGGKVTMSWRIDVDGKTTRVAVVSSTLADKDVEGCMVRNIERWTFPKPEGDMCQVSYPFTFNPGP
jgi:hypothetical protein